MGLWASYIDAVRTQTNSRWVRQAVLLGGGEFGIRAFKDHIHSVSEHALSPAAY